MSAAVDAERSTADPLRAASSKKMVEPRIVESLLRMHGTRWIFGRAPEMSEIRVPARSTTRQTSPSGSGSTSASLNRQRTSGGSCAFHRAKMVPVGHP